VVDQVAATLILRSFIEDQQLKRVTETGSA
jgi:RNase H-fold protein (predicted Holliday junction resolvase)